AKLRATSYSDGVGLACLPVGGLSIFRFQNSLIGPDFIWIEFVIDAHAHDVVRDAGIEVDSKRCRIRWQACGGRNLTEVQVKVFDLAGPIATQANFGGGAERRASLCRMAG